MALIKVGPRAVIGSEDITIDNTAGGIALTASKYRVQVGGNASDTISAKSALVTVESNPVRVNLNPAVTVTATTNGHEFDDNDSFEIEGAQIPNFRAIRTGGSNGVIHVTYFV
jgi:hypothetical protein